MSPEPELKLISLILEQVPCRIQYFAQYISLKGKSQTHEVLTR